MRTEPVSGGVSKAKRVGILVVGTLAVGLVAFFVFRTLGGNEAAHDLHRAPSPASRTEAQLVREARDYEIEGRRLEEMSEAERAAQLRDEVWATQGEFLPISGETESLVREWRAAVRDESGLLSEAQRDSLLRHMAEHARARGRDAPDAYRRLIEESEVYAWNRTPATESEAIEGRRRDVQVGIFYRYFLEEEYDPSVDLQSTLTEVWEGLRQHDHLFDAVGIGETGAAIVVQRARVPAQLNQLALSGKGALDPNYWMSIGARYGMQFSKPVQYAADAMADGPGIVVAYSHILVRMRDGRIFNWMSRWYWDDSMSRWVLDMTQSHSSKIAMLVW